MENLSEVTVRTASPEDAREIKDVFYYGWLATYPNQEANITTEDIEEKYKDRHSEQSLQKLAQKISSLPKGEIMLVAKISNKVVGVCRATVGDTENRIIALYVLPENQRTGIGTALWQATLRYFDSTKQTLVDVASYNVRAIRFYERLGFTDTGKRMNDARFTMKNGATIPEIEMRRQASA